MSAVLLRAQETMLRRRAALEHQRREIDTELLAVNQAILAMDLAAKLNSKERAEA